MALQTSGQITLNDIHVEAGGTTGTQCQTNDSDIRDLIGIASGTQRKLTDWYGASSVYFSGDTDYNTNFYNALRIPYDGTNTAVLGGTQYYHDSMYNETGAYDSGQVSTWDDRLIGTSGGVPQYQTCYYANGFIFGSYNYGWYAGWLVRIPSAHLYFPNVDSGLNPGTREVKITRKDTGASTTTDLWGTYYSYTAPYQYFYITERNDSLSNFATRDLTWEII